MGPTSSTVAGGRLSPASPDPTELCFPLIRRVCVSWTLADVHRNNIAAVLLRGTALGGLDQAPREAFGRE